MPRTSQELRVGELADAAGVHVETVRYYQRRGLLPRPPRPPRGWRIYGPETLGRLRFIRRAQSLGFSLDEIGDLLQLRDEDGEAACARVDALTRAKIETLETSIRELEAKRDALARMVADCDAGPACRVLEALDGGV